MNPKKTNTVAAVPRQAAKNNILLPVLVLIILTITVYSNSINNNFTNWDDNAYIENNYVIRSLSAENIHKMFTQAFTGIYVPLVILSYSAEYHFFKLDPRVYHATNLVLHIMNVMLVFWLIFLLSGNSASSFICAALFAAHPLHVESVAWISERKDVLYAMFFLASLISYQYFIRKHGMKYYLLALFFFILSVLSKPMAVTLPFILMLFDYIRYKKLDYAGLTNKLPFILVSILIMLAAVKINSAGTAFTDPVKNSPLLKIPLACFILFFYISKTIIPLKLASLYPYNENLSTLPAGSLLISTLFAAGLVFLFYKKYRNNMIIAAGLGFLSITILPCLQLVSISGHSIVADRYTYLPMTGLFYLAGEWVYGLKVKSKNAAVRNLVYPVTGIIIIVFSAVSFNRVKVWKNSYTLWDNVIKNYPGVALAYNGRANAINDRAHAENAIADFNKAIELNPRFYEAYLNRADAYHNKGDDETALLDLEKAIEINPGFAEAYVNRGKAYALRKNYTGAISNFDKAITLKPGMAQVYYDRANSYFALGNNAAAIKDYTKAVEIDPGYVDAYFNRGITYGNIGEYNKAFNDYNTLTAINPKYPDSYYGRGIIYFNKKEYQNAVSEFTTAIMLNPSFANAYHYRAITYSVLKENDKMMQDIKTLEGMGYNIDYKSFKKYTK